MPSMVRHTWEVEAGGRKETGTTLSLAQPCSHSIRIRTRLLSSSVGSETDLQHQSQDTAVDSKPQHLSPGRVQGPHPPVRYQESRRTATGLQLPQAPKL